MAIDFEPFIVSIKKQKNKKTVKQNKNRTGFRSEAK